MRLNHLDLQVADVDGARAFFERFFGLRCKYQRAKQIAIFESDDGFEFAVSNLFASTPPAYPPDFHLGFVLERSGDVRDAYDRLTAGGVAMKLDLGVQGPALVFQCLGPDNIPVEVRAPKGPDSAPSDVEILRGLNSDYIRSVQNGDVQRFREILADDFSASLGDGTVVDRTAFLDATARPVTISQLQAHDVQVRVLGDVAVIHGRTTYTTADGRAASGRYTDVWAKRGGRWLAIAAHVTRG